MRHQTSGREPLFPSCPVVTLHTQITGDVLPEPSSGINGAGSVWFHRAWPADIGRYSSPEKKVHVQLLLSDPSAGISEGDVYPNRTRVCKGECSWAGGGCECYPFVCHKQTLSALK